MSPARDWCGRQVLYSVLQSSRTTQASRRSAKSSVLRHSSFMRLLKDSMWGFSQGEPGSSKAVWVPQMRHQARGAAETNSGQLSMRGWAEAPRWRTRRSMAVMAPSASMLCGLDREGLSGELVDVIEQLDAAQIGGLLELEVQHPHMVWALGAQPSGGAADEAAALGFALRRALQTLVAPDALCALGVGDQALAVSLRMGLAPSEAWMAAREVPQVLAQASLGALGRRCVERC